MRKPLSHKTKLMLSGLLAVAVIGGAGATAAAQTRSDDGQDGNMMQNSHMSMMQSMGGQADGKMMDETWQRFDMEYMQTKDDYDQQVRNYMNMAYAGSGMNDDGKQALYDFNDQYKTAWADFEADMKQSRQDYMTNRGKGGDMARNQFNDDYNRASAAFMGSMEDAKNQLAKDMDAAGMAEAKDMFMNHYNMAKDMYGQHMEMMRTKLYDML